MAVRSEELVPSPGAVVYRFPRRRLFVARRRRAAVVAIGLLAAGFLLAGGPEASVQASKSSSPPSVVFAAGDTLWALAELYGFPGTDPRAYVDAVQRLNHLEGAPAVGRRLLLPR